MHIILEHVAVGEYEEALSPSPGISALLCVARERNLTSPKLPYHKVPIVDAAVVPPEQLADAVEWIHRTAEAGAGKVLVFAGQGISRPPSVVIAYLCLRLGYPFEQAVETVARRISPISLLPGLAAAVEEARWKGL
ncbi:MAG TPA: dual specificity protein phosphatase [Deltaproteobacteria bacterium]|jgi:protein-tyrosine phosphatase|nr:dual specificity protein phosphatase [Pseudomonadota bacterium]HNU73801.1 dual specificity protein phosphatase [Deltaproteobacteria bacterium]HPX50117.1 dual specificity protein phosphatase [Deltaproteobacteria bacterium]HQA71228.1 dual specificity protein phosphatase [Deltaproteobacteria bacterium]